MTQFFHIKQNVMQVSLLNSPMGLDYECLKLPNNGKCYSHQTVL